MKESWNNSLKSAFVRHIHGKRGEEVKTERSRQEFVDAALADLDAYAEVLRRLTPEANDATETIILPFLEQLSTDAYVRRFIGAHGTTLPADIRLLPPVAYSFPREAVGEFGNRRNSEGKPFFQQAKVSQYFHAIDPDAHTAVRLPENRWETALLWRPRVDQQRIVIRTTLAGGPRSMAGAMLAKQTERELPELDRASLLREIHPSVLIAWGAEISTGRIFETIASQVR